MESLEQMKKKIRDYIRNHIQRPSDWIESNFHDFNTTTSKIHSYVVSILERYDKGQQRDRDKANALVDFLLSGKNLEEYSDLKNIDNEEVRYNLINSILIPDRSFKSVSQLLNKPKDERKDKTPTQRIIRFACSLFELELPTYLAETHFNAPTRLEQELSQNIRNLYLKHEDFTQIRVVGDICKDGQSLSMDDYYMDLSYLEREDIEARDSLLLKEKESFRNKISQNKIPHSYISDSILATDNRVVIMGNPGTGKSTFARWLCHHWAKAPQADQPTLIYISLRELNLNHDNQVIEEYIDNNYLKQKRSSISKADISQFVARPKQVRLVLDGLDELSDKRKKLLDTQLGLLKQQNSYILLSRPYGLFNNSFHQTASIEIIGYNNTSRSRYIASMLTHNASNMQEELFEIIQKNPVLNDLSYNPLMLSYLTLLYLDDEVENSLMAQIESTYQLQDLVLGWMSSYTVQRHAKQGRKFAKYAGKGEALADHLELKQEFVYYSRSFDDVYGGVTKNLAKAGLGRKEILNNRGDWKFHFQTITTQEYLAAKHVGERISPEAFLYVVQKQIYWNYAKMILGYKTFQGDHEFIGQILTLVNQYHQKSDKIYYKYLYFSLLSETGIAQLNTLTDQELISDLLYYHDYASADTRWYSLISDAIARIYAKLSHMWQKKFIRSLLNKAFSAFNQNSPDSAEKTSKAKAMIEFAYKLNLFRDAFFVELYLKELKNHILVVYTSKSKNAKAEENNLITSVDSLLFALYDNDVDELISYLKHSPESILKDHMLVLREIAGHIKSDKLQQSIHSAQLCITNYQKLESNLETLGLQLQEVCKIKWSSSADQILKSMIAISLDLAELSKEAKDKSKEKILLKLEELELLCLKSNKSKQHLKGIYEAYQTLQMYSVEKEFHFIIKHKIFLAENLNQNTCQQVLNKMYKHMKNKADQQEYTELFVEVFNEITTRHGIPYNQLDSLIESLEFLLKQDKPQNSNDEQIAATTTDLLTNILSKAKSTITTALDNYLEKLKILAGSDKTRSLVLTKILNSQLVKNQKFVQNHLPYIIRESEFYAPKVWNFVYQFTQDFKLHKEVIKILNNADLYLYPNNIQNIGKSWEFILSKLSPEKHELHYKADITNATFLYLQAIHINKYTEQHKKILSLLLGFTSIKINGEKMQFPEIDLGKVYSTKSEDAHSHGMREKIEEYDIDLKMIKNLSVTRNLNNILFFCLTGQTKQLSGIKEDYNELLLPFRKDFMTEIIRLLSPNELLILRPFLGEQLHQEIMNYAQELNQNNQLFNRKLYLEKMNA